ncbi:hypothetical protein HYV11_01195 [Candidatus Dependentiae bacterium]|nr:hypothetical protein [Candidatus Dependentiae bacterium]
MKKTNSYIFLFLCCGFFLILSVLQSQSPAQKSTTSLFFSSKRLILEKKTILSKLIVIPGIMSFLILNYHKTILDNFDKNPISSLVVLGLIANFVIDTISKYNQIAQVLFLFQFLKRMCKYIIYAHAIKNTMMQIAKKDSCCSFDEKEFCDIITDHIPFSFHDLDIFFFEQMHNCTEEIQAMHLQLQTNIEEKIYLSGKEHIGIEEIVTLYGIHDECFQDLKNLIENPIMYYKMVAFKLNSLIKKNLKYMIKHHLMILD